MTFNIKKKGRKPKSQIGQEKFRVFKNKALKDWKPVRIEGEKIFFKKKKKDDKK